MIFCAPLKIRYKVWIGDFVEWIFNCLSRIKEAPLIYELLLCLFTFPWQAIHSASLRGVTVLARDPSQR